MEDVSIEIEPQQIQFSVDQKRQEFTIQNVTIQYVWVRVISPNKNLFSISQTDILIDPFSEVKIQIQLNWWRNANLNAFTHNSKLVVLTHTIEQEDDQEEDHKKIDWIRLPQEKIQFHYLNIDYDHKVGDNLLIKQFNDQLIVAVEKSCSKNLTEFTEEQKKQAIHSIIQQCGQPTSYSTTKFNLFIHLNQVQLQKYVNTTVAIPSGNEMMYLNYFVTLPTTGQPEPSNDRRPDYTAYDQQPKKWKPIPVEQPKKIEPQKQEKTQKQEKPVKQKKETPQKPPEKQKKTPPSENDISKKSPSPQQPLTHEIHQDPIKEGNIPSKLFMNQLVQEFTQQIQKPIEDQRSDFRNNEFSQSSTQVTTQVIEVKEEEQFPDKIQAQVIRRHQSEILNHSDMSEFAEKIQGRQWNNFQVQSSRNLQKTPVVFLEPEKNKRQEETKESKKKQAVVDDQIHVVGQYNLYSTVKFAFMMSDGATLVTVSSDDIIHIYQMESEIGQMRDQCNLKNGSILGIREWSYIDPHGDDDLVLEDPNEQIYTSDETEQRIVTWAPDSLLRIYNMKSMKIERTVSISINQITTMCFLVDKSLFCLAGQPEKEFSFLGMSSQMPKFRYLKFYRLDTLKEFQSFKLNVTDKNDSIECLEYTNNQGDRKHSRLNHILAVYIYNAKNGGNLIFLFIDRLNKCTILMNLVCDQLGISGIHSVNYFQQDGTFVVIENSKKDEQQKVLITQEGMQSGLVCKSVGNTRRNSSVSIQTMSDPNYIILTQENLVIFYDMASSQQIKQIQQEAYQAVKGLFTSGKYLILILDSWIRLIKTTI